MKQKSKTYQFNKRLGDYNIPDIYGNINKTPNFYYKKQSEELKNKMELPKLEVVEGKEFDTSLYVGIKTKIESLKIETGDKGFYLRVETESIGLNDEGKPIKPNRIFGLKNNNGKPSISNKGELFKFMQNKKVQEYTDLIGKEVIVLAKKGKDGKDWLYFE